MKRFGIALLAAALIAGTSAPALASYTNGQWANGWPHKNIGWCLTPVAERWPDQTSQLCFQ